MADVSNVAAFAGLFYLSLYLAGKLHILDKRGEVWKFFIVMIPTLAAALIAVSRIMDARHHPFDVISGSLLGIMMAYGSYRQYFPPISESWRKGRAYPIRSWASEPRSPRPDERQVARDEGVEPLRSNTSRIDEEQPGPAFKAPRTLPRQTSYAEPEVNVFRQQVSRSQRLRQSQFDHSTGPSESSTESDAHNLPAAFSNLNKRRKRQRQGDGVWSVSSSDHELDGNTFELQPHQRSTAPALSETETHPAFRVGSKDLEQDTGYHPRVEGQSPNPGLRPVQASPRGSERTIDSATSLDQSLPPAQPAGPLEPREEERGVQLVETYRL